MSGLLLSPKCNNIKITLKIIIYKFFLPSFIDPSKEKVINFQNQKKF